MRQLTRTERAQIVYASGIYLPYVTMLNRDDFTLWKRSRYGGMDRIDIDRKIVSKSVK